MNVWRTYLFVPGNQYGRIGKAVYSNADAVIIDLEDSVAINEKEKARECVSKYLEQNILTSKKVYIRVNDLRSNFWEKDLELVARHPFLGIMLPKTESALDIRKLNKKISLDQEIIPLIETGKGILFSYDIAASAQNVVRLAFGAVDYCLDLGISLTPNEFELIYPRSSLVVASRAAGIASPIDTVYVDIDDDVGLVEETKLAIQQGLFAKLCIHPKQVEKVNQLFIPSEKDILLAEEIVDSFEKAERKGQAAIRLNGKMIDYPVYKQALLLIDRLNKQ